MINNYYNNITIIKEKLIRYLNEIFKVYGNELALRLEEYNLLNNVNNCIETSTATGFILEEFITSKLETYTKNHNKNDLVIHKLIGKATANSSADCYSNYQDIFVMINTKVEKVGSSNNAVAALNILHNDYVKTNPDKKKTFVVLKTVYEFGKSKSDRERKILIKDIYAYCLEEVNFESDFKQDHRNWSKKFNPNSGRLQLSKKYIDTHLMPINEISYERTKTIINNVFRLNETKREK